MSKKNKKSKKALLIRDGLFSTVLSLLVCYLLSLAFTNISFFNPLSKSFKDFSFLDVYYAERLDQKQTIDSNLVLVNIEHKSREELVLILQKVLRSKPKVVGFDIILKEFEETATDTLLAQLINQKNVVSGYIAQPDGTHNTNHPFFIKGGSSGFVNFNFDSENSVVREFKGLQKSNHNIQTAFTVELAKKYFAEKTKLVNDLNSKITDSRVINYQGGLDHYLNLTADELMLIEDDGLLQNKIILLGYLGSPTGNQFDIEDKHFTPLNSITAGKSMPDMYGLVLHANILSMLIEDKFMYKIPTFWQVVLILLFSFLASIYFIWLARRLKISYRTVRQAVILVFTILFVWMSLLLFKKGIVIKSAPIIVATIFSASFVKYYKHLVRYIKTKRKFKSYLK